MKSKTALPPDVNEFFKGTSVFFSSNSTNDSSDKKSNGSVSKGPHSSKKENPAAKQNGSPVPQKNEENNSSGSSSEPNGRTVKPNGQTERSSIILELAGEVKEVEQRRTERYSFEIYVDQIGTLEDLQYRYKKKTGKRLSSSRIIREALDEYLKKAEKTI
ncbi:MAG: hypothetical protein BGO39_15720 [Chloroflexi bacterium 54-19]|nr:MAG: hypothetical protein BGO39_15720 [Chloroflexi bacterium 54-19]